MDLPPECCKADPDGICEEHAYRAWQATGRNVAPHPCMHTHFFYPCDGSTAYPD
ncbi:hypothetical protein Afil01_07680 [Actinorhabdospora filicis]|uniref:Uncharacterized protein n=1 Tax=Actinorhabdospora filicis TaxID=1785913 RepID=A0A9W6SI67_9ACTN|nr:hypothetical protein Afil01_07680 [Actinorhabdospora filicis]